MNEITATALIYRVFKAVAADNDQMQLSDAFDIVRAKEFKTQDEKDALAIVDRTLNRRS